MINAGSSELNQKWKNVLHNTSNDYIIPESDINVMCPYDCTSLSGYTVTANSVSQSTPSDMAISPIFMNRDKKIATFEWNFWVLDGSFEVLDTGETYSGFLSSGISDENCEYSTNPFVFFDTSAGLNMRKNQTLKFAPSCDDVPAQISIFGANSEETKTYYFNIEETLETQDILNQEYVHLYSNDIDTTFTATRIGVAFQKSLMPYRRARLTEYNNGYKFFLNKYDMQTFVHTRSCPLSMEELPQNDLEISFADMERLFDTRYANAPFHIEFNASQRFYVYYAYNFDDIGWSYVWVDSLIKNEIDIDRESLVTTLRLQSTLNSYNATYGASSFKTPQTPSPSYDWNDFNGFLMAISHKMVGVTDMFSIGSQTVPDWEIDRTSWQYYLKNAYNIDESVSNVPLKEMAQQIVAMLGCVMVRQPNETFYLKYWINNAEVPDYIENTNIFAYPTQTKGERYKYVYINTPKTFSDQADDETTVVDRGQLVDLTLPAYKGTFNFENQNNVDGEIDLNETVVPLGAIGDNTCWNWYADLWGRYASTFWKAKAGTTFEFSDLLLNPLLQVGDRTYAYINEGYNAYQGHIEKIEINYDGSFRGSLVINSAGLLEGD